MFWIMVRYNTAPHTANFGVTYALSYPNLGIRHNINACEESYRRNCSFYVSYAGY